MTLTTQDLHAIRGIVTDTIKETVPSIVDSAVGKAIDELSLQVGASFNEMTERFEGIEADITEFKTDMHEVK
ncbi:MAG: hypothetical protein JWN01_1057 [Patescibacteria group bacterium]|nr:hypothetical protein [Patescibacteria group bacterium]